MANVRALKKKMIGFRGCWVVKNLCDLSYFFLGKIGFVLQGVERGSLIHKLVDSAGKGGGGGHVGIFAFVAGGECTDYVRLMVFGSKFVIVRSMLP